MSLRLERILYGPTTHAAPGFGVSDGLSAQEALLWRGLASLDPLPSGDSYGLFNGPAGHAAFARAGRLPDGAPMWEYLIVPHAVLLALGGDLGPLCEALSGPFEPVPVPPQIEAATLPNPAPWPPKDQRAALELMVAARGGSMEDIWSLLGMALHERGLMIYGGPANGADRLRLVQALSALLPASARPLLTFTAQRAPDMPSNARIAFAERSQPTGRWIADWEAAGSLPTGAQTAPYVAYVRSVWQASASATGTTPPPDALSGLERGGAPPDSSTLESGAGTQARLDNDLGALSSEIVALDATAARFADGRPLAALLTAAAERRALDRRVLLGEPVPPESLRNALRQMPAQGELTESYASRLLDHALQARDTDAALQVARAMDADPALDAALWPRLHAALDEQPDAAYAFVRARVASGEPTDTRWLERLTQAANAALRVALDEGDVEVVRNWLRLLAREPLAYGLAPALDAGLDAARPLGEAHPDLARTMLVVAAKRAPDAFARLLDDEAFTGSLPPDLRALLCAGECDTLTTASGWGVELLLAALARAAAHHRPGLFTPETIETLWSLAYGSQTVQVAEPFSAPATLRALANEPAWLPPDAVSALLANALTSRQDALFQSAAQGLASTPDWPEQSIPVLTSALIAADRPAPETVALLGGLVSAGRIPEAASLAVTVNLLDARGWNAANLPLAIQAARGAQLGLPLPPDSVWQLLELARATRDEAMARDSARRTSADLLAEADDAAFTAGFARLTGLTRWNPPTSAAILDWWRGVARTLPTARLARLDKAFGQEPELSEAQDVAGSLLALRRMLGKRTLAQFAQDVAGALALLQSLDEAFEGRREDGFDAGVVRADLSERLDELSPSDARLLANQLAALAQLVGELGDSRTKPALLRREDADQALAHGESEPQSAVDALKWMSGFLGGAHRDDG